MDILQQARAEIEEIDREMAALFERRMAQAAKIAAYKKQKGLPIRDEAREAALEKRNLAYIHNPTLAEAYRSFLRYVIALSCQHQQGLMQGEAR